MINTLSHSVIMFNQLKTNKKNPNEIGTSNLRILLDQAKLTLLHNIYYSMKNKLQVFFFNFNFKCDIILYNTCTRMNFFLQNSKRFSG